jgi:hypothetical protein
VPRKFCRVVKLGFKNVCFDALISVREDRLGREVSFCVSGQVGESELEYISGKRRSRNVSPVSRVDRMRSCAVETLTLLLKYLVPYATWEEIGSGAIS